MAKNLIKYLIVFILTLPTRSVCQQNPGCFTVTNTSWNISTPGSFPWALSQALLYNLNNNPPGGTITRVYMAAGIIPMLSLPQPITLQNPGTLIISKQFPNAPPQGFNMAAFAGAPNTAYQGLNIDNSGNSSNRTVEIDGITFNDFYAVGGGPCIFAQQTENINIHNCIFNNADIGINFSKIQNLAITTNTFNENVNIGGGGVITRSAIFQYEVTQNTTGNVFNHYIYSNTFSKTNGTQQGAAIYIIPIAPSANPSNAYNQPNIDMNLTYDIHDNTISNYQDGIIIGSSPYNRSGPDVSLQVNVHDNSISFCMFHGVVFSSPYKHFGFDNNTITTDVSVIGSVLQIGDYLINPVGQFPNFNYSLFSYTPNKFGFTMDPTATPPVNSSNVFNALQFPGQPSNQVLATFNDLQNGVDIVQQTFPGNFRINGGKFTNIRKCLFNQVLLNNNMVPPINLQIPSLPLNPNNQPLVSTFGNGNIATPIIQFAKVRATDLKVIYTLQGAHINNTDGPYVVEFFKADNIGNLTFYLGKQTVNVNAGNSFTITLPYAPGANLQPGDRVGMTVTSLGTSNFPANAWGTSEIGYYKTCGECISDFAPEPGKNYVLSGWVSGPGSIEIQFLSAVDPDVNLGTPLPFSSSGAAIDGWKKIDGEFTVPANAIGMKLRLVANQPSGSYFDDIRVHPKDAVGKSYVYDPESMRLMAELDERNYATLYEYDEEGKLVRVKKETERGVMTIKESRNNKPIKQ